jgi:stage III sporulation protein AE
VFNFYEVHAEETLDEIYDEQIKESGAEELPSSLPEKANDSMKNIGINKIDLKELFNIDPGKIFKEIFKTFSKSIPIPLKAGIAVLTVIIICAVTEGMKTSNIPSKDKSVLPIIGTLCICIVLIMPVMNFLNRVSDIIKGSSTFMLTYIPVFCGIILSSGQPIVATSYHIMMMSVAEIISQVASHVIVPLLSSFLAASVISSISDKVDISGICTFFHKTIKWLLGISMTIFTSVLSIQSLLGSAAGASSEKAIKFIISSFVPIVGGALSDAFVTVHSGLKLLKSGVGAFGIIAFGFIFLPIIAESIIWLLLIQLCSSISVVFGINQITGLLDNTSKLVSIIFSIILCCMTILIISTVIVLTIGSNS